MSPFLSPLRVSTLIALTILFSFRSSHGTRNTVVVVVVVVVVVTVFVIHHSAVYIYIADYNVSNRTLGSKF